MFTKYTPNQRIQKFWSRVNKESGLWWNGIQCWVWLSTYYSDGYGQFHDGTRTIGAHRFSYQLASGPIPDGLWVLHHCDHPACVNPAHLFLGTHQDNVRDMVSKGRNHSPFATHPELAPRGEQNGNSKLTAENVREIRRVYAAGEVSLTQLARRYGVCVSSVCNIIHGKTWRHVA